MFFKKIFHKKKYDVSQVLSGFFVLVCLGFGLLITLLLAIRMGEVIVASQENHVNAQLQALTDRFTTYLQDRDQVLMDHSKFPILIQTLMQPETNVGIAQDFLSGLSFLGQKYQEILLDFKGKVLASSKQNNFYPQYEAMPWVEQMLNKKISDYQGIHQMGNFYYWRLAKPIELNGFIEGILVVEIPMTEILETLQTSQNMNDIAMEIFWQKQLIHTMGVKTSSNQILFQEPFMQLTLKFFIDDSQAILATKRLLLEIAILIFLVTGFMLFLSLKLGKIGLVRPIEKLQSFSTALANGQYDTHKLERSAVREYDQLALDLTLMAGRIQRRENALYNSRNALEKSNQALKNSQAQLIQSEKMASLGIIASGIAHEINNPISFVKGNFSALERYVKSISMALQVSYQYAQQHEMNQPNLLQSLEKELTRDDLEYILEDLHELLMDSKEGTQRVADIVSGLKDFARIEQKNDIEFDLNQCIESTLKVVWNELKYKCEVVKHLDQLPKLVGNPGEINQVIMNLLVNAVQAISEQGIIHIATTCQNQRVLLTIKDNGSGIDANHLQQLFTPFFTTKEVGKGTGLGLSISHGIVEKHGGYIEVQSELGVGSTFMIYLPVTTTMTHTIEVL